MRAAVLCSSGMSKAESLFHELDRENGRNRSRKRAKKIVPNPWVQFRISDVYVPEPAQILMELHGKDELLGKVIDVSTSEIEDEAFAVVEVEGLLQPVVVAMKHVKEIRCE